MQYIYEQLRDPKVRSMAVILEKTSSAYYNCFRHLFKRIVVALAESKDIDLYLKPLKKHFEVLEETDFGECAPLLTSLMYTFCLVWSNSKHYDQIKAVVLLKQICNLLIHQVSMTIDMSGSYRINQSNFRQQSFWIQRHYFTVT